MGPQRLAIRHENPGRRRCRRRRHPVSHAEASPSPRLLSLNGSDWRFQLFDRPEAVPPAFSTAAFDASDWPQARGPGQLPAWVGVGEAAAGCLTCCCTHTITSGATRADLRVVMTVTASAVLADTLAIPHLPQKNPTTG